MAITKVKLENFTVFDCLELEPSPGVNVFVGANGTGKTHLLKVCYAACDVSKTGDLFSVILGNVFLPAGKRLERLINRGNKSETANIQIFRGNSMLTTTIFANSGETSGLGGEVATDWTNSPVESVYIPTKEMLSNAPGFLSLYEAREIHFEEVYRDILLRAYRPEPRQIDGPREKLLKGLEETIGGQVVIRRDEFFLRDAQGYMEFTLLAEGLRKLGLLWLLIRNGALGRGAVLFWDEPEANLNPKLYGAAMQTLLGLQRLGVQVFLATHDYVILREVELQATECDKVAFHSLHRTDSGQVTCHTANSFQDIHPNAIEEAFDSIFDRVVTRSMRGVSR